MAKKVYVGADNFTKRNLPSGYTQVEYIQAGGTQYIDPAVVANKTDSLTITMVAQLESDDSYGGANGYLQYQANCANGKKAVIVVDYDDSSNVTTVSVDGIVTNTWDWTSSYSGENVKVGVLKMGDAGNVWYTSNPQSGILWSWELTKNGVLVRDLVPCTNASGTVGLYDMVNGVFYANAGTGTFTAGAKYLVGVAREAKKIYVAPDAVARTVVGGYIGDGGVARKFWDKLTPMSSLDVGNSVYMNVNGISTEFIIIHKGLPSSVYASNCDGIWLMMKDIYTTAKIGTYNSYSDSTVHSYLNNTFPTLIDGDILETIVQVNIPYIPQNGLQYSGTSAWSGAAGLSTKFFVLSATEVGASSGWNNEGAVLDYFNGCANSKRIAYLDGTAKIWWLRTPSKGYNSMQYGVGTDGSVSGAYAIGSYSQGVRPVFVLPSTVNVDGSFRIVA